MRSVQECIPDVAATGIGIFNTSANQLIVNTVLCLVKLPNVFTFVAHSKKWDH
jgi:hypothetical protein